MTGKRHIQGIDDTLYLDIPILKEEPAFAIPVIQGNKTSMQQQIIKYKNDKL